MICIVLIYEVVSMTPGQSLFLAVWPVYKATPGVPNGTSLTTQVVINTQLSKRGGQQTSRRRHDNSASQPPVPPSPLRLWQLHLQRLRRLRQGHPLPLPQL